MVNADSIWQNCPICKKEGKDNNKTTSNPKQSVERSPVWRKAEKKVQLAQWINWNYFAILCIIGCKAKLWLHVHMVIWGLMDHFGIWMFAGAWQHWQSFAKTAFTQRWCPCGHMKEQYDWGELVLWHIYARISVALWHQNITLPLQMRQKYLAWGSAIWGVFWTYPVLGCIQQQVMLTYSAGWD